VRASICPFVQDSEELAFAERYGQPLT